MIPLGMIKLHCLRIFTGDSIVKSYVRLVVGA